MNWLVELIMNMAKPIIDYAYEFEDGLEYDQGLNHCKVENWHTVSCGNLKSIVITGACEPTQFAPS